MILATLCYVKRGGRTLMLHRTKRKGDIHQGKWNGLGGKLESGETPEECVVREVREESGLTIRRPAFKGVLTFPAFSPAGDWYVYVFVAREFQGELTESDEGALQWIEDEQLASLPLWEGDPIFLKWLDGRDFFSGKFVYRDGRLLSHSVVFHGGPLRGSPLTDAYV